MVNCFLSAPHPPFQKRSQLSPRDLLLSPDEDSSEIAMKQISDGQLSEIIKRGCPEAQMSGYYWLEDKQIWQLVLFILQSPR